MSTTGRSNWQATLKTVVLLSALGGILVGAGYLIGGPSTALIFLFIAVAVFRLGLRRYESGSAIQVEV